MANAQNRVYIEFTASGIIAGVKRAPSVVQ
jgi:hypothetical protein